MHVFRIHSVVLIGLAFGVLSTSAVAQVCQPTWSKRFGLANFESYPPSKLVAFDDDGNGPEPASLYAVGSFNRVGNLSNLGGVVRWDGMIWGGVGAPNLFQSIQAFVYDSDASGPNPPALYLLTSNWFARWDGRTWENLPPPVWGFFRDVAVFDEDGPGPATPAVFVSGLASFNPSGTTDWLHKWDGQSWTAIQGVTGGLFSLAVFDDDGAGPNPPALFAGGDVLLGQSQETMHLVKWDGQTWTAPPSQPNDTVWSLTVYDDDGPGPNDQTLYAGGEFVTIGGVVAYHIARWDGTTWSPLGNGSNVTVRKMLPFDEDGPGPNPPRLFTTGVFSTAGGTPIEVMARWDGSAWSQVGEAIDALLTPALVFDPDGPGPLGASLLATGTMRFGDGTFIRGVVRWNGSVWSPLSSGLNGPVRALRSFDADGDESTPPVMVAGGEFTAAGGIDANRIAQYDGRRWAPLGEGIGGQAVHALAVWDEDDAGPNPPRLFAGGDFTTAGASTVNHIARWDGASWSALADGLDAPVLALTTFDEDGPGPNPPVLIAGGEFTSSGGQNVNHIARWNGTAWSPLGAGRSHLVTALGVFDDDGPGPNRSSLFAATNFLDAGGYRAGEVNRWNGNDWSTALVEVSGTILDMAVFDLDGPGAASPQLLAVGEFLGVNGQSACNVVRFDGALWTPFAAQGLCGFTASYAVNSLSVFDEDGSGLRAATMFAGFSHGIGRWDGASWPYPGGGIGVGPGKAGVLALAPYDPDGPGPRPPMLFVGGEFDTAGEYNWAGGNSSVNIAAWVGCSAVGDLNCDGRVNGEDLSPFVLALVSPSAYLAAYPECSPSHGDFDGDGLLTVADIAGFANALTRP